VKNEINKDTASDLLTVVGKDGLHGTLGAVLENDRKYRRLLLDDGREYVVPVNMLTIQKDGSYYLALSRAEIEALHQTTSDLAVGEKIVLAVTEESLAVGKREIVTGLVRLQKTVREHEETVDEPLLREQVNVERVAINQLVDGPIAVRQDGDTMIIPVLEEVLVIEKRLMLKEELRVTVQRTTVHDPQTVTLRTEEINIERIDPTSSSVKGS